MKNWKKYLLSLAATVVLLSALSVSASAATPEESVLAKINAIEAQYPHGSYFSVNGRACYSCVGNNIDTTCGNCGVNAMAAHNGKPWTDDHSCQCLGFVRYVYHDVFGVKLGSVPNGTAWTSYEIARGSSAAYSTYQNAKPGDVIYCYNDSSYSGTIPHYAIFISADEEGVTVFHSNTSGTNRVEYAKYKYKSVSPYLRSYVAIRRANNYPTCAHKYEFNKSTKLAACIHCEEVYHLPATTHSEAFMDVVAVNKDSNSAPVHNEPYGDSQIPNDFRYHLGDTVYVTGYVKNAFGNTWYQLSGGEWVTGDYLGTHSHRYNSDGYCTRCLDKLSIVFMYMKEIPLPADEGSPIHYAPYGDSAKLPVTCSSSVTINGKIVNGYGNIWYSVAEGGWVYGNYITSTAQPGTVNLAGGSLTVHNHPDGSSPQLGTFSAGQKVYVYLDETIGNWYSVFGYDANTRRAGFVDLNRITLQSGNNPGDYDDYKGLEPLPEPLDPPVGDTPSTPSTPSGPSTVSLSYPTDPTYTGKITVGETNATVVTHIAKPAGTHVSACGLRLYDASWNLIKDHYEPISSVGNNLTSFHAWYDIQAELGVTLAPASTYYYQFYTVVDGGTYSGESLSFTTTGARVSYPTDPTYVGKFAFSDTNATVVAAITKPAGSRASACGLRLYDASRNLIKDHYEELNFIKDSATTFYAWYDIQAELGITLTPGTTYYYQFYTVVNGNTYSGETLSFTTTGTAPHTHTYDAVVTAPTCTQDGYTTYTCSCGDSYIGDEIQAMGHIYDDDQDASCNICGEEREVILPDAPTEKPTVSGIVSGVSDATVEINGSKADINADGSFSLPTDGETFDVVIKAPGALTHTIKNISGNSGDITLPAIELVKGDTNGDDMINIMDMAAFRQNFGKTGDAVANAFTDTNGDGMVNIMDMGIFRKNFGKTAAKDCTVEYSA